MLMIDCLNCDVDQLFVYRLCCLFLCSHTVCPAPARNFFERANAASDRVQLTNDEFSFLISFLLSSILLLPPLPPHIHHTMLRSLTRAARPAAIALARSSPVVRSSSPTHTLTLSRTHFFFLHVHPPFPSVLFSSKLRRLIRHTIFDFDNKQLACSPTNKYSRNTSPSYNNDNNNGSYRCINWPYITLVLYPSLRISWNLSASLFGDLEYEDLDHFSNTSRVLVHNRMGHSIITNSWDQLRVKSIIGKD